ncbi:phosphonate C-P lyase system protein PhnG [Nitratireductor sp. L1-7-SE]|uniref:Phosphonate C-P lyase system protein PhnG n=1 Tax=Nitratireductor rhodophyticola TaxID=2854036 RepID=A0ABS7R853_9HYPH|nr:phosphonate C-P lyase system protein PhnG [Nitratireductor rhodophyticola]MBY8917119.1 phosphonate C-P lyase system protein PhnG [Nitratireductor rhodophyticola]MBY8920452.1 phosphonate C-P lyase system protein PhnG [Nitratireductor rhodophyticola]
MVSRQERQAVTERRREAMAVLAMANGSDLMRLWNEAGLPDEAETLRGPETGLVTVRGRMGGGGAPFNFGEATVTRATVKLPTGEVGHAYALGREKRKARVAALIDALRQKPNLEAQIEEKILAPLRARRIEADATRRAETAATKVDFFTMVRGED